MNKEQVAIYELEKVLEWLEASREDFVGESSVNILFVIGGIKKVINKLK